MTMLVGVYVILLACIALRNPTNFWKKNAYDDMHKGMKFGASYIR